MIKNLNFMESLVEASEIKQLKERIVELENRLDSLWRQIKLLESRFVASERDQHLYEDFPVHFL